MHGSRCQRRPAAHHRDKAEGAPHEHQHRDRDRDSLRRFGAEQPEQAAQHQVEQNVGGLPDDHQPLRAPALDQLRQPRIVDVAGKVAGLHSRLPVDRRQQQDGHARCTTTFAFSCSPSRILWNCGISSNGVDTLAMVSPICWILRLR